MAPAAKSHGQRVWEGDLATVKEARARYLREGIVQLLPFASALYSARHVPRYKQELIDLRHDLLRDYPVLLYRDSPGGASNGDLYPLFPVEKWPDRVDMFTSYSAWFSVQPELDPDERANFKAVTIQICLKALPDMRYVTKIPQQAHSYYLTVLTLALLTSDRELAQLLLNECIEDAARNLRGDVKQRARVFIKMGIALRKQGMHIGYVHDLPYGYYWGIRGCIVLGRMPLNVRKKGVAALLGIER